MILWQSYDCYQEYTFFYSHFQNKDMHRFVWKFIFVSPAKHDMVAHRDHFVRHLSDIHSSYVLQAKNAFVGMLPF